MHVTLPTVEAVGRLRKRDIYRAVQRASVTSAGYSRSAGRCRICHISIQGNHIHLLVEADNKEALSRGMQGFEISCAKRINAALTERTGVKRRGSVFADRYHARALRTPREVRNCLGYVLNNWRHHGEDKAPFAKTWKVDPFSSGALFPDWKELEDSPFFWPLPPTYQPLIVFRPRTWLLQSFSRVHPLISVREVPGRAP